LLATSLVGVVAPAGAVSAPEVVATGLNDPYKLSFDADGDLFVAEAGTGGDECVTMAPPGDAEGEEEEVCFGLTGSVTRVVGGDGAQSRVVTGLPSIGGRRGGHRRHRRGRRRRRHDLRLDRPRRQRQHPRRVR
jgi:hypothetical protein